MLTATRKTFKASAQPYVAANGATRPDPTAGSTPALTSRDGVVVAWRVLYHLVGDEEDTWRVTQPMFEVDAVTEVERLKDKYGEYVIFPHDGPLREIRGEVRIKRMLQDHERAEREAEQKVAPRKWHLKKWHEGYVALKESVKLIAEQDDHNEKTLATMEKIIDQIVKHCEKLSCSEVDDLARYGIFTMERCMSPTHDERLHGG